MSESAEAGECPVMSIPVFPELKTAITHQFGRISAHDLFRTETTGEDLWETYLASFPEGSNPVYRKRAKHDCSCCRQFVKAIGNVVAIVDNELVSIWDVEVAHPAYRAVTAALSAKVKAQPIANRFMHEEPKVGTDKNHQDGPEGVLTWEHFYVQLPRRNENPVVVKRKDIGPKLSESRAQRDVLFRSLTELTAGSAETVLDLIDRNALYRGEEHKAAVAAFLATKRGFDALSEAERDLFVWQKIGELSGSVSKIRNTSIGQLLIALSDGGDLEESVKAFERMVAPANYKRPTALVTQKMVDAAREAVEELGLTSALDRRFATLADVSVNNVLFADRSARTVMKKSAFDGIAAKPPAKSKGLDNAQEVPVETFLSDILPGAEKLEIMVENRHAGNFVSLIAPADPASEPLFMWDNRFSWSYSGDVADSVRERVKKAGGNVTGDLCCRLAWSNFDDLDLHMVEPSRYEIFHVTRGRLSPSGGTLDVDMNAGGPHTREPVENIYYPSVSRMNPGVYWLFVHQFNRRERTNVGFEVEIDILGSVLRIAYDKSLMTGASVDVAELRVTQDRQIEVAWSLPSTTVSRKVWNVDTETFRRVNVVMLSPNHWNGKGVGNRHYFWMLDQCRNDGSARGFYNEFLGPELAKHRKVFEILGGKMRAEESPEQLSGLGFSSTQRNHLVARVTGATSRIVKVTF